MCDAVLFASVEVLRHRPCAGVAGGEEHGHESGAVGSKDHRYKHATNAKVTIEEDGTATIKTRWGQTYVTKLEPVEEPPF